MLNKKNLLKRLSTLGLIIIFVLLISAITIAASCPEEMTHYWKLDEETGAPYVDSYGTNDATCTNCPMPIMGIIGGSQQFDGIIDEVKATDDGTWNWSKDDSFSIEYWMKTNESSSENIVIVGRILLNNNNWWVGCYCNGTVIFHLADISGNDIYVGNKGNALNDDNWHHVVAVRDGSAKQNRIYVDGVKIDEKFHTYDADFYASTDLNIGHLGGNYRYNGIVDEVATYDRALTDAEILAHYNSGLTGLSYCEIECQTHEDCNDNNVCTDEVCVNYICQYTNNATPCDDGIFCNGTDTCSGGTCSVHSDNPCPETECNTCQEDTDSCFDLAGTSCTDDGNVCTDDICDGTGECVHPDNSAPCDDDIFCNGSDICVDGSCSFHSGNPCPETECNTCQEDTDSCFDLAGTSCNDDGNVCTDDQCDGAGECVHPNNNAPCDDGIDCTENDVCSGSKCNGIPNNSLCSDGNVCTDDICTIGVGCSNPNNTKPCEDGIFCNGTDTCSGGTCSVHSGNPCPEIECNICQEDTDSCFDPAGTSCIDDGNVCTNDQCDGAGVCVHPDNNSPCDDGIFCNGDDTCSGGNCSVHTGDPCAGGLECNDTCQEDTQTCYTPAGTSCIDDGNVCTNDQCDGAGECVHPNNNAPCDDGIYCTENDECSDSTCNGTPNNSLCDDSEFCTYDICTVGEGCSNPPIVYTVTLDPLAMSNIGDYGVMTALVEEDNVGVEGIEVTFEENDFSNAIELSPMAKLDDLGEAVVKIHGSEIGLGILTVKALNENGEEISDVTYNYGIPGDCASFDESTQILGINNLPCETEMTITCEDSLGDPITGYLIARIDPSTVATVEVIPVTDVLGEAKVLVEATADERQAEVIASVTCGIDGDATVTITLCDDDDDCNFLDDQCNVGICVDNSCVKNPTPKNGASCDDGLFCRVGDFCNDGECVGTARNCDDGLFCTGTESCNEVNDKCVSSGDPCLIPWLCNEINNTCYLLPSCSVDISPSSDTVKSVSTIEFTAETTCNEDIVEGNHQWEVISDIGSSINEDTGLYTAGNNDTNSGVIDTIIVTDTTHDDITDTAEITVEPKEPPVCEITIEPLSATVSPEETITFTATIKGEGCLEPDYTWHIDTDIDSQITADSPTCLYQSGNNETGILITDTVTVTDNANGTSTDVKLTVLYGKILGVFPKVLLSSRWVPLPHMMIIIGEGTRFNATSYPTFDPDDSIVTIGHIGLNNLMGVLLLLSPYAEEGFVDLAVTTTNGGGQEVTFTKEDAFRIGHLPFILDESENKP